MSARRIALIGIIVEDPAAAEAVNAVLHDYTTMIVGRLGLPYRSAGLGIISIVTDGTADETSSLAGKLGMISGISVKTMYAKKELPET